MKRSKPELVVDNTVALSIEERKNICNLFGRFEYHVNLHAEVYLSMLQDQGKIGKWCSYSIQGYESSYDTGLEAVILKVDFLDGSKFVRMDVQNLLIG